MSLPSETHYSLKEMETYCFVPAIERKVCLVRNPLLSERDGNSGYPHRLLPHLVQSQKPTTLWKRWKLKLGPIFYHFCRYLVRNPLLSERDGNVTLIYILSSSNLICQKPTTLWKRWKPSFSTLHDSFTLYTSETHYSLKEMETIYI